MNKKWIYISLLLLLAFSLWRTTLGMHSDEVHSIAVGDMIEEGNIFFKECWFYLQMSAVFTAPIIKIFKMLTGGTEGILLCFRILSVIIQLFISIFFFNTFSKDYNKKYVLAATIAFFVFIPDFQSFNYKQEFIWFSLLEIIFAYRYYRNKKKIYLILLGLTISAAVLAYPTSVLQFFLFVFIVLWIEKEDKAKTREIVNSLCYLIVPCVVCALLFIGYVLKDISVFEFWRYFLNVFKDENLNSAFISKLGHPLKKFIFLGAMTLLPLYISAKIVKVHNFIMKYSIPIITILLWGAFALQAYIERRGITWHCITYPYSLTIFLLPVIIKRKDKNRNTAIFYLFELPAIFAILSMALASNQGNVTSMYGTVISALGFILMMGEKEQEKVQQYVDESKTCCASIVIMAMLMFIFPIYEQEAVMVTNTTSRTIFTPRIAVEYGPAKGISVGEETFKDYDALCSMVSRNVDEEDRLFIIDDHHNAAYGYLASEGEYATFSPQGGWGLATSDRAIQYFEENPAKIPSVVLVNLEYVDMPISEYMTSTALGTFLCQNDYIIDSQNGEYVVLKK